MKDLTMAEISEIDKRVSQLEAYFKVGIIVAAIFGVSGGIGALTLRSASNEISALQLDVAQAQTELIEVTGCPCGRVRTTSHRFEC